MEKLSFASDYQEGAHPKIIERLMATNLERTAGYGLDEYCQKAKEAIKKACAISGDVWFLVGGTQTNAVVIDTFLRPYEGVISADTGHISGHEAGAIEYGGHKVLPIKHKLGKIDAKAIGDYCRDFYSDGNHEHMVHPGMVYLSQPTEYGTLYSLAELEDIRKVCDEFSMYLYIDGARLAYGFGAEENDVTLKDLGRLCDAFYIGGTKCGTLFGEALVIPKKDLIPHFFTMIKQHGALLAKGRMLGIQFLVMFEDDLYLQIGKKAVRLADKIRKALVQKGYRQAYSAPTNQIFVIVANDKLEKLAEEVVYSFWEKYDDEHTVIRLVTSWSSTDAEVERLIAIL